MGRTLKQSSTKIASCFFFVYYCLRLNRAHIVEEQSCRMQVVRPCCFHFSVSVYVHEIAIKLFLRVFFPTVFFLHVFFSLQNKRWHSMMDIDLINVTLELSCLKIIYIKTFISVFHFLFGGLRWRMLTLVSKRKN